MNKRADPLTLIFFLAAVLLTIFLVSPAWATDRGDDVELNSELVGGDVNVSGDSSRALGFGRSSFDVDINQCLGSTAWDTILGGKQKLVLNWVCMAEFYLANGEPELAAMAVCNTEVLNEFSSEAECEAAHDFFMEVTEAASVMEGTYWEEEEEWHEEQMQMQQDYDERIATLEARLDKPAPKPQVIERTVVEQKPYLSDEKRAKLQALLEEDK